MKNPALACGVFHVFICHWLLGKIIHYALILPSTIDHSSPIFLYEKKNMAPLENKAKSKTFCFPDSKNSRMRGSFLNLPYFPELAMSFPGFRRVTIKVFEYFFGLRVF